MKPVTDKAEVAIDFPDKAYMGSFGHGSAFEANALSNGIELALAQTSGPKRRAELHIHYYLFADILDAIAATLEGRPDLVDQAHRPAMMAAADRLANALRSNAPTAKPQDAALGTP